MAHLDVWILFMFILLANVAGLGVALCYWSKPLAKKYVDWIVRDKSKYESRYRSMFILFRLCGGFLLTDAIYEFLDTLKHLLP